MKEYQTQQRKRLFDFFAEHPDREFSVEDIAKSVTGISKSAIYRNINWLVKTGAVNRIQRDGSRKFLYQYLSEACASHLHLRCDTCGNMLHMEADALEQLEKAVTESCDFRLDMRKTVLTGSCASCK